VKRSPNDWIRLTRNWTVASWGLLSAAIIAGMWWSYDVLGWGGYWAWDPVENASFLPWLTATAFSPLGDGAGAPKYACAFGISIWSSHVRVLTILGTFLTRSGIISSVHAFTTGTIGYYFLAFIALVLLAALAMVAGNSERLKTNRPARLGRLARNDLPLEQSVPHRVHAHRARGNVVPARRGGSARVKGERRQSVFRSHVVADDRRVVVFDGGWSSAPVEDCVQGRTARENCFLRRLEE